MQKSSMPRSWKQKRVMPMTTMNWILRLVSRLKSRVSRNRLRSRFSFLSNWMCNVVSLLLSSHVSHSPWAFQYLPYPVNHGFLSDVIPVLFFRTRAPVEPVAFVRHICRDALNNRHRKRTRFTKRLSPMTLVGKATEEGLESVAKEVLAPAFRKDPPEHRKVSFAFTSATMHCGAKVAISTECTDVGVIVCNSPHSSKPQPAKTRRHNSKSRVVSWAWP